MNEATGEVISISKAHLVVKHQNVADAEITAEIAMRNATFVSGEVIGIGTGAEQTVSLANTNNLSAYKFALYVNGVQQTGNFSFYETSGQVTFIALSGAIVSADYFYNWGTEKFVAMENSGTYPDHQAIDGGIAVTPASATWQYNSSQNTIVVTAPFGQGFSVSY